MIGVERPAFRDLPGIGRFVTIAGIAGVVAGIAIGGVGGRLFMRIAGAAAGDAAQGAQTEAGFTVGEITSGGTAGLLLFVGVASGLIGAAWFVVFRPWLRWTGRWRGLAFGGLLFAIASATSDVLNPDNVDFAILGHPIVLVVLIAGLFLGFGLVIEPVFDALDHRLPSAGSGHPIATTTYALVSLLGLVLGGALLFQTLFTRNLCSCDPPIAAALGTSMAAGGTILWMVDGVRSAPTWVPMAARVLGFGGLLVASAGLMRALGDVASVVRA